jgi:hypothetical protein
MDRELKKINSETIMIFNDFMRSIMKSVDMEELDDYFSRKSLRAMILDLITLKNTRIEIEAKKDDYGHYQYSGIEARILENIKWIKRNLDVWDIQELPYKNGKRIFEFKRKELKNE